MSEIAFWQGNEAIAYGALAAECRFFGGYPITPSSEIAEKETGASFRWRTRSAESPRL